jgi:hypothetical protein
MYIENPEKLLTTPIVGKDGQIWIVCECSKLANAESDSPSYEFLFITDVPVKSSPNQVYYSMTKAKREKAELTLYRVQHENVYELVCAGQSIHGPISEINNVDGFIEKIKLMLPTC